jgi:energy-coupling factor transport system permease protein
MSATTGYFIAGSSWLHRRHPLTKGLGLAFVLLSAFLLPPIALPVLGLGLLGLAGVVGLLRPLVHAMRIPALLLTSILVVNSLFYPGATDRLLEIGPLAVTREGLTFGLVSAGRVLVAFLASVLFLFTTLADDLLESMVARGASHRIAFVILSAVQMVPRMQARAGSILEAQQARGLRVEGSLARRVRALVPLIGPVLLGSLVDVRERTFALEARGFGARPGRTAYRKVPDSSADRAIRPLLILACLSVIVVAVTGVLGR